MCWMKKREVTRGIGASSDCHDELGFACARHKESEPEGKVFAGLVPSLALQAPTHAFLCAMVWRGRQSLKVLILGGTSAE